MGATLGNAASVTCLKGVVLCKFDLSFGPVPVTTYPPDFLTGEQSKRVAMRSLLKLGASQEKAAVAISAFDEVETMWIGILGTFPVSGFYALAILFDVNVPSCVSDNLDRIETLLAEVGLKFPKDDSTLSSYARDVFTETQELLNQLSRESTVEEHRWSKELEEAIEDVARQMQLVIDECRRTEAYFDRNLTDNAMAVIRSFILLAVKCNLHPAAQTLISLLTQLERI